MADNDVPNEPEDPAPYYGDSMAQIFTVPEKTVCEACTLPVMQGQTAVRTDVGYILHAYCWETR